MVLVIVISAISVATAFLTIFVEIKKKQKLIYLFKPLTTCLIILVALLAVIMGNQHHQQYSIAVIIGLVLCLGGDVALMFKPRLAFLLGLISFLLGHVAYIIGFSIDSTWVIYDAVSGAIMLFGAIIVYSYLYNGLGKMKIPVLLYTLIISFMVNRGISTFFNDDYFIRTQAYLITFGAFLFYVSDVMLGISKFKVEFKYNRISLAFYFMGQLLIALSVYKELAL